MKRVAVIDIPFRQRTKSTDFLLDLLRQDGADVREIHWLPTMGVGGLLSDLADCEVAVLIQVEVLAPLLQDAGIPTVSMPMWDAVANHADEYWEFVSAATTACFSLALHLRLRGLGQPSQHHKFFPEPASSPRDFSTGAHGFFWERRPGEALDWPTVNHFFGPSLTSLHVHLAADPGYRQSQLPSGRDVPYALTSSKWRRNPVEYKLGLQRSNVYFAPRRTEGIGMSYLEAFSQGLCVVAFDDSTHNEYISDGLTGILLPGSLDAWRLDFDVSDMAAMAMEGWHTAQEGYRDWATRGASALVSQLLNPPPVSASRLSREVLIEVVESWGSERFYPTLRKALRRGRTLSRDLRSKRAGTAFEGVVAVEGAEFETTDSVVRLLGHNPACFVLSRSGRTERSAAVSLDCAEPVTMFEVGVEHGPVLQRQLGQRKSILLALPAGEDDITITISSDRGGLVRDVRLVDAVSVTRQLSADFDLGLWDERFSGLSREVALDYLMLSGESPYDPDPLGDARTRFLTWALHQHLVEQPVTSTLLADLADTSWSQRAVSATADGLALSQAYRAVLQYRRTADTAFASQYAEDTPSALAWYYLHGVAEHSLASIVGDEERAYLLTPDALGVAPFQALLGLWRDVHPSSITMADLSRYREHPGIDVLFPAPA